MSIQTRYWNTMVQSYFECTYLGLFYEQSVKRDRKVNIFLAIASCSSIAGWAIWNQFSLIWAIIVAVSQVINAIKPYLPYSKRIEELFAYENKLREHYIKLECDWYGVSNGMHTEEEVNTLISDANVRKHEISKEYLYKDCLPRSNKFKEMADNETNEYFAANF